MGPGDSDIGGKFSADSENNHYNEEYSPLKKEKRRESSDLIYLKNPMEFRCPGSG